MKYFRDSHYWHWEIRILTISVWEEFGNLQVVSEISEEQPATSFKVVVKHNLKFSMFNNLSKFQKFQKCKIAKLQNCKLTVIHGFVSLSAPFCYFSSKNDHVTSFQILIRHQYSTGTARKRLRSARSSPDLPITFTQLFYSWAIETW